MNKTNYDNLLTEELKKIERLDKKPTLLLHACCAPCASAVVERLKDYFNVTLYYFNPNIYPEAEYEKRYDNLVRLAERFAVGLIKCDYDPNEYFQKVSGLEREKEGGKRCKVCTFMRIENACKYAKENGFDYFSTTLSISPLKDTESLNEQGRDCMERYGVKFLFADFKKKDGYKRSIELCRELKIYRQNYCGCIFARELSENA